MRVKLALALVLTLLGRLDLYDALAKICMRESRCTAVTMHDRDAHLSDAGYRGQVALGHLDRECQHIDAVGGWATHGPFGLSAASHWKYLPRCYPPTILDYPLISAWVAVNKYIDRCEPTKERQWCG